MSGPTEEGAGRSDGGASPNCTVAGCGSPFRRPFAQLSGLSRSLQSRARANLSEFGNRLYVIRHGRW
jgi:hypothetical protein